MFPSGIGYNKQNDRVQTKRVNSIFSAIPLLSKDLAKIKSDQEMIVNYISSRRLSDLAIGLIKGAAKHFKEGVDVAKIREEDDGQTVMLKVSKI